MGASSANATLDTASEGICLVDVAQRVTYWNLGAERLSGLSRAEVVGSRCTGHALVHVDPVGRDLCHTSCLLGRTLRERRTREGKALLRRRDGRLTPVRARLSPVDDPMGRPIGALQLFSTTLHPERAAERFAPLPALALFNGATGLPLRQNLELVLPARLAELERMPFGVLHLGLDNLGEVRASHGAAAAQRLHDLVAGVLSRTTRAHDVVGHWDDDAYLVVASAMTAEHLLDMAARLSGIIESLETHAAGSAVGVTVAAGVALAQPFDSPASLVRRAAERARPALA